jgi:hypothetical protein
MSMKILRNLILVLVAMSAAAPAAASPSLFVALPDLSALSVEAGSWIGDELRALQRTITTLPRLLRADRTVSVTNNEGANHIFVVASRLPSNGKRLARH